MHGMATHSHSSLDLSPAASQGADALPSIPPSAGAVPPSRCSCRFPGLEVGRADPIALLQNCSGIWNQLLCWPQELARYKGTVTSGTWNGISFCSNCHLLPLAVPWVWEGPGHGSLEGQEHPSRERCQGSLPTSQGIFSFLGEALQSSAQGEK